MNHPNTASVVDLAQWAWLGNRANRGCRQFRRLPAMLPCPHSRRGYQLEPFTAQ